MIKGCKKAFAFLHPFSLYKNLRTEGIVKGVPLNV